MHMLRTRSRIAFIDDSADFLEGAILAVPPAFAPTFHRLPETLSPVLAQSAERVQREEQRLLEITSLQKADERAVPMALEYLADPQRFEITSVLVADFAMPNENGVSLCARLQTPGLQRILLTGKAGDDEAVVAFNARSIDMFIPKRPKVLCALREALQVHMNESAAKRGAVLRQALSLNMAKLLANKQVCSVLDVLLAKLSVVEHMVLGAPQGLLAVTEHGKALWIQLEDEQGLAELSDGLDQEHWSGADLARVKAREAFVNLDFMTQLGQPASAAAATCLSEEPYLGAAIFELTSLPAALRPAVHSQWLAMQAKPAIAP